MIIALREFEKHFLVLLVIFTFSFINFLIAKDTIEKEQSKIIEMGEKNEYSIKVYTLLALSMMRENKYDNALKIFNKALESLNILEDHTQYAKYVVKGNEDLAAF